MGFLDQFLGTPEATPNPMLPNKAAMLSQYMQPQQAPAAAPRGALSAVDPNDVYDAMIQAGAGLLAPGSMSQKLSQGFTGFNKGLEDASTRRIAARKLSLEELKASKPSVTPSGVPGHVLLTYPDGRTETVINDDAVKAYNAQQDRLDARAQAQIDAADRRFEAQQAAADRRQQNMFGQQLTLLGAKNDAKTAAAEKGKAADAMDSLELLDEAGRIVGDSTSSYFGNMVDKGAGLFGASTKGADTAARLKVLGGYLTSKVPKMSGPTSDKDMATYKEMAGSLGDPTVPLDQKKAAIDTMLGLNQKYAGKSNKVTPPSATGKTSNGITFKVEE